MLSGGIERGQWHEMGYSERITVNQNWSEIHFTTLLNVFLDLFFLVTAELHENGPNMEFFLAHILPYLNWRRRFTPQCRNELENGQEKRRIQALTAVLQIAKDVWLRVLIGTDESLNVYKIEFDPKFLQYFIKTVFWRCLFKAVDWTWYY